MREESDGGRRGRARRHRMRKEMETVIETATKRMMKTLIAMGSIVFGFDLVMLRLRFATVSGVDVSLSPHLYRCCACFGLVVYPPGLGLPKSLVLWLSSLSCSLGVSDDQSINSSFSICGSLMLISPGPELNPTQNQTESKLTNSSYPISGITLTRAYCKLRSGDIGSRSRVRDHSESKNLEAFCDTRHLLYGGQRVTPDASSYNNVIPVSLTLRMTGHQQYPRGAHSPPTNRPKHYRKGARFIHTPKKCSVTHARRRFIDTSSLQLNRSTKVGRDLHTIRHTAVQLCPKPNKRSSGIDPHLSNRKVLSMNSSCSNRLHI
ncbi:hypothetical protein YC2023_103769 [Brassica napus]